MRTRKIIRLVLGFTMLTSFASFTQAAGTPESEESAIGRTPPRVCLTAGEVSFWRPGAEDWTRAQVNTPLAPGDLLYTGSQGKLEIQIGSRAFVRAGPNTELGLENHEPDFLRFKVTEGNASFDLRTVEPGRTVEVGTPNAAFTIEHQGYYRVNVTDGSTSFITRRGGRASVAYAGATALPMNPNEEVVIEGTESPRLASYPARGLDEWDNWNYARTDQILGAASARYVSADVYGLEDLDHYGTWRVVPTYGPVWVPREVPSGWAPYSTGAWIMDPYYGWTWVDNAPWGWAPYHYGRWVFVNDFWAWAPGPVLVRPAYAPALVAFLGGPSLGVSVRVGLGPVVAWVALGWGEPCAPWWGPAHFRHRAWWGGWGGPRFVDKRVVRNTTVVNVKEIKIYRNVGVRNAVVGVKKGHFGRGPITSARVKKVDVKKLKPIQNGPPVNRRPASFVRTEKRGIRPAEKISRGSVVANRPPQARVESSPGRDRNTGEPGVISRTSRILPAPEKRETAPVARQSNYGRKEGVPKTSDPGRPPAPPKAQNPSRPERAPQAPPSVIPKAPLPKEQGPQVAGPPAGGSRTPTRPGEPAPRPPRAPKGEHANRLSPAQSVRAELTPAHGATSRARPSGLSAQNTAERARKAPGRLDASTSDRAPKAKKEATFFEKNRGKPQFNGRNSRPILGKNKNSSRKPERQ